MADVDDLPSQLARRIVRGVERAASVDLMACDGGAITIAYTHMERVTLCATDDTSRMLEEAQDVMGQGPGHDAFTTDLYQPLELTETDGPDLRWPLLESDSLSALARPAGRLRRPRGLHPA